MPLRAALPISLALLLAACDPPTIVDDSTPGAQAAVVASDDAGGALPDGATAPGDGGAAAKPDLTAPPTADLAGGAAVDLAKPSKPDLASPSDLGAAPDLASPPDLAKAADLAKAPDLAPPPSPPHHRCGWIGAGDDAGYATFAAHASWFDAIHPDWFAINADGVTVRPLYGNDSPVVLKAAAANHVQVIPLVAGVENASWIRGMMTNPVKRAAHVKELVQLAVARHYDGLDIDYEHLGQPGDQAAYSTFMAELSVALHAQGKQLSAAVQGLSYVDKQGAFDYVALSQSLDQVHIMGYDFHTIGTHAGPTAPLGWIDGVAAYAATMAHKEKFILGLPNYGVTPTWFCSGVECPSACTSDVETTTDHMTTCGYGFYEPGRAPHCQTDHGDLFFEDAGSLEEKVKAASSHGLGGVTYWTVGSEPSGFFSMVKKYF